ncbi:MAG: DUF4827 domain-containing protein, partial [Prevotellaceae bacterium]|nr:DUF4827 domain-containing protein [Prevotellaceae bacterium]
MKKAFIILVSCVISFAFFSCNDQATYAENLKAEKKLISDYIKRNNIKILSTPLPSDQVWPSND